MKTLLSNKSQEKRLFYSFFQPKNLNLDEVIRTNAPEENSKFYKYYKYIITKIIDEEHKNDKYSIGDFVNLKMSYLRNIITRNHPKRIIDNLEKWGIIEINRSYTVGVASRSYRLCAEYRNKEYDTIRMNDVTMSKKIYNHAVVNQLKEYEHATENNNDNDVNIYTPYNGISLILFKNLIKQLDDIVIDTDKALDFVNSQYTGRQKSKYIAFIYKFANSEHFFTVSKKVGRVFTTLSNCPKSLIQFLTIDGKRLKEIDIANSQPLFLNFLINDYLKETGTEATPDIELYRDKTMNGELYQFLLSQCRSIKTLDELKDFLFRFVYYGKNSKGTYNTNNEPYSVNRDMLKINEIKTLFQTIFPTVFQIIRHYKIGNYANLAIQLQRAESSFIIPLALELSKDFPLFTKHDAILTTEENLLTVVNALTEAFQQQGMTAKCRLK